ncbi:SGNH/GDSL hydrolase family protein [Calidifontibacter sp. DB0510]|uniref:SGNH/GDSL hydrolase family protein n=2 Tax=Metallococcus carri TaxID=1656884 RepID=A0A967AYU1_9MICO|nr:SGNH/GDSL hydrolase family protein [Metallococcus carri]NOP38242.1 SGNH/GDSL hydrolase family protein [Calidifontibacter sp. DB2511S]
MSDADPAAENAYVGWADRLAARLAAENASAAKDFGYANLAVRGRLLGDVVGPQLDAALEMRPDLVSIVGGGNDILRPKADLDRIADRLEEAVIRVRSTGADVLLATTADPGNAPVLKKVRPRTAIHTANVWAIAQRQGAHVLDIWSMRVLRDSRMWAADRLHLSTEGHIRVAAQAWWALGFREGQRDWTDPLPPAPPLSRRDSLQANAVWAKEYLAPWVQRRLQGRSSGDEVTPKRPTLGPI